MVTDLSTSEVGALQLGLAGFDRIADTSAHTGNWCSIRAINGTATFADGCESIFGDDIAENDTIAQDNVLVGAFKKIILTSGIVYAYRMN